MKKMYPLEPAGEDLLRRARAHSITERELPIAAEALFALFEEGETWCRFFPVIRKVEWTSPRPCGEGTTRTVTVIGGIRLEEVFWTWKPGARMGFALTASSNQALKGLVETYDFIPIAAERCRMRWEMGIEMNGAMRAGEARMAPSLAWTQRWCLGRLDELVERRRGRV